MADRADEIAFLNKEKEIQSQSLIAAERTKRIAGGSSLYLLA